MYNIVENPIPKSDLFATMTLEEVQEWINKLPSKDRATASLVLMFTLNACNKLVEDEILSKEVFCG
jgi:hypothetical protein